MQARPRRARQTADQKEERIRKIMDAIPKNLAAIVDPFLRSEVLANHMAVIDKSTSSEAEKTKKLTTLILEYIATRPEGLSIDPSDIEKYMAEIADMAELMICARGTRPDECVSDADHVLKFLGTSRAELQQHLGVSFDILLREMKEGRDYVMNGKNSGGQDKILLSHDGMKKLARRLTRMHVRLLQCGQGVCSPAANLSRGPHHKPRRAQADIRVSRQVQVRVGGRRQLAPQHRAEAAPDPLRLRQEKPGSGLRHQWRDPRLLCKAALHHL